MSESDFKGLVTETLGENISLLKLEKGDLLFAQPKNPLSESATDQLWKKVKSMMPEGVELLILPSTWTITAARRRLEDPAVAGLRDIVEDLS